MAIWSDAPHMKQPKGNSATQNTSVGSGSRPTASKYKIEDSAPKDAHKLDGRGDVPGALGQGGSAKPMGY